MSLTIAVLVAGTGCARRRPAPAPVQSPLLAPEVRAMLAPSPDSFAVALETTKGLAVVSVVRSWAPRGADRLYYLVRNGFYDGACFYRVVPGFVAQFGLKGEPPVDSLWRQLPMLDDPVRQPNVRATVAFATSGPNTRTTQLFINLRDNAYLNELGFAPVGRVTAGMEVVDSLYGGYGEGPSQPRIEAEGAAYIQRELPKLDCIRAARIIWESGRRGSEARGR